MSNLISWKSFYKNKAVLVSGGCGFIGSHIAELLANLGAKVTVFDNLSSGFLKNLDFERLNIDFVEGDIRDIESCKKATYGKEIIFHLAAFISVPDSLKNPDLCYQTNIEGTKNLLGTAYKNQVKRFIFSSSSAVYGTQEKICTEEMACKPESPYGFSKLIGELWLQEYARTFGMATTSLRYFNVYGPRQNPEGHYAAVVAQFKKLMHQNLPLTIYGDGYQTRDFIPVEKVAQANLILGAQPEENMKGQVYNIATGKSINLFELVELLKKEFPRYSIPLYFEPERKGDIKHSQADISKYRAILQLCEKRQFDN